MAHALSITDGTTTFSLSTTNCILRLYTPVEPQAEDLTIVETVELAFTGASVAAMRTAITTLQALLEGARRRKAWGVGPAVYLQFQPDGEAAAWRSELLGARLEYDEDALKVFGQAMMPASLILERATFWEGALVQLPLTNGNGTANTAGLTIRNHDDGTAGNDNYVQIAGADVTGSLPAPLVVELTNTTGAAVQYGQIFMASNAFSDPANLTHVVQAESAIVSGFGTVQSDASCSNGQYVTLSFASYYGQSYTLSQALLRDALGYEFHLLARFKAVNSAAYVRPQIYDSTGAYQLWQGDEVYLPLISPAIADLGVIPLPPGGYTTLGASLRLRLEWRSSTTTAVDTDFFALFPANTYRRLVVSASCSNGGKITDDPVSGRAWLDNGSGEIPAVAPQGMPLTVWPGVLQRVYFLWYQANMAEPITQTFTVKLWYRPRRRSF